MALLVEPLESSWRISRSRVVSAPSGSALRAVLRRLKHSTAGRTVCLYLLKPVERLRDPDHDLAYRTYLERVAREIGLHVLDGYEADFSSHSVRELLAYPGEGHPGPRAHEIYAEFFHARLGRLLAGTDSSSITRRSRASAGHPAPAHRPEVAPRDVGRRRVAIDRPSS